MFLLTTISAYLVLLILATDYYFYYKSIKHNFIEIQQFSFFPKKRLNYEHLISNSVLSVVYFPILEVLHTHVFLSRHLVANYRIITVQ